MTTTDTDDLLTLARLLANEARKVDHADEMLNAAVMREQHAAARITALEGYETGIRADLGARHGETATEVARRAADRIAGLEAREQEAVNECKAAEQRIAELTAAWQAATGCYDPTEAAQGVLTLRGALREIGRAVGQVPDEPTIDAARRVVADRDAMRARVAEERAKVIATADDRERIRDLLSKAIDDREAAERCAEANLADFRRALASGTEWKARAEAAESKVAAMAKRREAATSCEAPGFCVHGIPVRDDCGECEAFNEGVVFGRTDGLASQAVEVERLKAEVARLAPFEAGCRALEADNAAAGALILNEQGAVERLTAELATLKAAPKVDASDEEIARSILGHLQGDCGRGSAQVSKSDANDLTAAVATVIRPRLKALEAERDEAVRMGADAASDGTVRGVERDAMRDAVMSIALAIGVDLPSIDGESAIEGWRRWTKATVERLKADRAPTCEAVAPFVDQYRARRASIPADLTVTSGDGFPYIAGLGDVRGAARITCPSLDAAYVVKDAIYIADAVIAGATLAKPAPATVEAFDLPARMLALADQLDDEANDDCDNHDRTGYADGMAFARSQAAGRLRAEVGSATARPASPDPERDRLRDAVVEAAKSWNVGYASPLAPEYQLQRIALSVAADAIPAPGRAEELLLAYHREYKAVDEPNAVEAMRRALASLAPGRTVTPDQIASEWNMAGDDNIDALRAILTRHIGATIIGGGS